MADRLFKTQPVSALLKALIKFLIYIILSVIGAIFIIVMLIHIPSVQNLLMKAILQEVSRRIEREVSVDSFYFSLAGTLEIKKFSIANRLGFGEAPMGECQYLYCSFSPVSLLSGRFLIHHLYIEKPVFRLAFSEDKDSNVRFGKKSERKPRQRGDDSKIRKVFDLLCVQKIDLREGLYRLDYKPSDVIVDVPVINMTSTFQDSTQSMLTQIDATTVQTVYENRINSIMDLAVKADVWGGGIDVSHCILTASDSHFILDGRCFLKNFTDPYIDFQAVVDMDLDEIVQQLKLTTPMQGSVGIRCDGKGLARDLSCDAFVLGENLVIQQFPVKSLQAHVRYSEQFFTVESMDGFVFDGQISGFGTVDVKKSSKGLNFKVLAQNIDLIAAAQNYNSPFLFPALGQVEINIESQGFAPSDILINGNLTGQETTQDLKPLNFTAEFRYRYPELTITSAHFINDSIEITSRDSLLTQQTLSVVTQINSSELQDIIERINRYYKTPINIESVSGPIKALITIDGSYKEYTARFNAESQNLKVMNSGSVQITTDGFFRPHMAGIDHLSVDGTIGKINGKMLFNLGLNQGSNPIRDMDLVVHQVKLEQFLSIFGTPIDINGVASGSIILKSSQDGTNSSNLEFYGLEITKIPMGDGAVAFTFTNNGLNNIRLTAKNKETVVTAQAEYKFNRPIVLDLEANDFDLEVLQKVVPVTLQGKAQLHAKSSPEGTANGIIVNAVCPHFSIAEESAGDLRLSGFIDTGSKIPVFSFNTTIEPALVGSGSINLLNPFHMNAHFDLTQMPIQFLLAQLPSDFIRSTVSGYIDAAVDTSLAFKSMDTLKLNADVSSSLIKIGDYALHQIDPSEFSISGSKIELESTRFTGEDTDFSINGSVDFSSYMNIEIIGSANLAGLTGFTDQMERIKGKAVFDLRLAGLAADPDFMGDLIIQELYFRNPVFNVWFEDFHADIHFDRKLATIKYLDGLAGNAFAHITGDIGLKNYLPEIMDITLSSDGLEFEYPEGFKSEADIEIALSGDFKSPLIDGNVHLKKTRYTRRIDVKSLIIKESKAKLDIRKRRTEATTIQKPLFDPRLNIFIFAADNVIVDNNFAKIEMKLDMQLEGALSSPRIFGQIEALDGTIVFQGRLFELERATINMSNPQKLDPMIDLLASTDIEGYHVSVEMTGPLFGDFFIHTYSAPPLNEIDIWSLIAIGKTQQQLSESSTDYVASGVAYVTGSIQDELEKRFKNWMGFDEFSIDPILSSSDETATARFTVKKRLSPNLTVTYSRSIAQPNDLLIMEYQLSDNIYLVGEKKEDNSFGVDIRFRWEFK